MKFTIVIPCYNETKTIRAIVDLVRAAPVDDKEIIVVDDCSRDGTRDLLLAEIAPLADRIIYHEVNRGKGAALRTGFAAATGEVVIVQGADLEYDPQEYPRLLKPIHRWQGGCRFWLALQGRRGSPRGLFLAHGGQQIPDPALEYAFRHQPHRHGNLIQGFPPGDSAKNHHSGESLWLRAGDYGQGRQAGMRHL